MRGYTPFEADITDDVTPGEEVRITALINNTLHWQSIPPGVIQYTPGDRSIAHQQGRAPTP
jgi:beta-glucuronidase